MNTHTLFFISLLLLAGLACSQMSLMGGTEALSGQAYWTNATNTPLPTQTVFLGMTTPVYPPTPVPAVITTEPEWTTVTATSNPSWEPPTATPFGDLTATPYWVTTTPVWITETPLPPWTTTPELPMIGFTTPVPADTPYYRVGTFYLHQDVYIDGPQSLVFRVTNWSNSLNPDNPAEIYLLIDVTVKNRSGRETAVAISDLFFIREVQTAEGVIRGVWLPKNDPLTSQGLPTYEEQLLTADGQLLRLAGGEERDYILGFILPNSTVQEIGLVTDWRRGVNGGVPIWFYLQEDPLAPFLEPCTPYIPGCEPLPPTPIVYDENGTYGGTGGTPPPGIGVWPTNGSVTRGYGCNEYYTGIDGSGFGCPPEQPWFHNGIDIANSAGNPIYSPIDGEMIFASFNPLAPDCSDIPGSQPPHQGLGNYQRITDGLTHHYLGHLSSFLTTSGSVTTGQNVSLMGSTGCSTGAHLHWIVYDNGNLVDPAMWAGPGPPP